MTEREQWRFQWPDGTWIRWNPNTQAWEKEEQDGAEAEVVSTAGPLEPPEPPPDLEGPTAEAEESSTGLIGESAPNESYVPLAEPEEPRSEGPRSEEPRFEEPRSEEPAALVEAPEAPRHARARRTGVSDVIPPREPERPGGALWPTIVAGAVLGIAVGLVIWSIIR